WESHKSCLAILPIQFVLPGVQKALTAILRQLVRWLFLYCLTDLSGCRQSYWSPEYISQQPMPIFSLFYAKLFSFLFLFSFRANAPVAGAFVFFYQLNFNGSVG